jgi:TetR/AcrR family transcriptional repressor of nem operon
LIFLSGQNAHPVHNRLDIVHCPVKNKGMSRQIAYDPLHVRQCLLRQFWAEGFAGTSLTQLEAATGLDRRQLYNGLGDKRAMFLQALDDFQEMAGRRFLSPLEAESAGLSSIRDLLKTFATLAESDEGAMGCFVCSTSQEEIAADPDVKRRVDAYFDRIEAAYRNALTRAAKRGELARKPAEIRQLASFLFGVHVSMSVLARAGQPTERIRALAEHAAQSIT